jgi:serine/threonine protein kinase
MTWLHSLMNETDPVETLCDEAEGRLRAGEPFVVESLVARCPAPRRERLVIELLLLEIDYQRRAGKQPLRDEYLAKYAAWGPQVESAFCLIDPDDPSAAAAGVLLASLASGQSFSHYQLRRRLGAGGTCEVWKATDRMTGRDVALKLPRWREQSIDERLRFLREGRALSRLRHPGVVTLYELGRDTALPYLAIELVEGGTLRDRLQRGALPARVAAELCQKLATALDHAHQRGLLHRDVKPANVLLRGESDPVLTDFGLAKDERDGSDLTEHGDVLGTVAYMPPEQAAGQSSTVDARADVYGVGAVLFESLTGVAPSRQLAGAAPAARKGQDPRTVAPSLPRALAAICHKATQHSPADRYASAAAMAADLDRYLGGSAVIARYPTRWRRALRSLSGSWKTAALILFCVVVTLGMTVAASSNDDRREVSIQVDPPETRIAFVPLREWGARRDPQNVTFGSGTGQLSARLFPGPYYVIAVSPDGRFHEVQRCVPAEGDEQIRPGDYRKAKLLPTGTVSLKSISLSTHDGTEGMTLVEGAASYSPGAAGEITSDVGYPIASFYMDREEFSPSGEDGDVWTGSYCDAVDAAERAGNRLPTELEYEFAATVRGGSRYPWGAEFPKEAAAAPSVDRLAPSGEVTGLVTGVAEWATPIDQLDPARPAEYAVVRGGDSATTTGDLRSTPASCDPTSRVYLPEVVSPAGVGFRGVRSATPLFSYEQMR